MAMIKDLDDKALVEEYSFWDDKIKNAKSWGAALTAADEFRKECEQELLRRGKSVPANLD